MVTTPLWKQIISINTEKKMRFKLTTLKEFKHSDVASCVGWASATDLYSLGDDHVINKWNTKTDEVFEVARLPPEVYCTDIHWFPIGIASKKHGTQSELFVLACTDGRFLLVSKSGRVEKAVDGHKGAVLGARWVGDGSALLTFGEDGAVKIWSRSGMLRSVLAQNAIPVYSGAWSPDNEQVLYTSGKSLIIKPLQPSMKLNQWKAHDGIVLAVDWNAGNGLIISGGEDRKYKVWDSYGRNVYTSMLHDCSIVSIAWSPDGELFSVGGFNTLKLCDKAGWSYSLDKPQCGTVLKLAWSNDGTQVGVATGCGQIILSQVVGRRIEWRHLEAVISDERVINVRNVTNGSKECLEFEERIIKVSLNWAHLIVTTASKCFIYKERNWTTPVTYDLKSGAVNLIKQAERYFLLVENHTGVQLLSYEGRVINTLKYPGIQPDAINSQTITISNDTVVIRDKRDPKALHVFDAVNGRELNEGQLIQHKTDVESVCLSQFGNPQQRLLAFLDKNHDLYISFVRERGVSVLLGSMVTSIYWNDQYNILAGTQDSHLVVWYYPDIVFSDKDLLQYTCVDKQNRSYPKNPQIISFLGNHCTLRRSDGALIRIQVSPFPAILHQHVFNNQWTAAVKLCRLAKDHSLWACLAGMSAAAREIPTAIIAYSAIDEVHKVHYLSNIQSIQSPEYRNAEISLFCHQIQQAESIYLQSGNIFQAIDLNMQLFNWERALELAVKYKTHVDTVLAFRQKYLKELGCKETVTKLQQYSDKITIDWEKVDAKVALEREKIK